MSRTINRKNTESQKHLNDRETRVKRHHKGERKVNDLHIRKGKGDDPYTIKSKSEGQKMLLREHKDEK